MGGTCCRPAQRPRDGYFSDLHDADHTTDLDRDSLHRDDSDGHSISSSSFTPPHGSGHRSQTPQKSGGGNGTGNAGGGDLDGSEIDLDTAYDIHASKLPAFQNLMQIETAASTARETFDALLAIHCAVSLQSWWTVDKYTNYDRMRVLGAVYYSCQELAVEFSERNQFRSSMCILQRILDVFDACLTDEEKSELWLPIAKATHSKAMLLAKMGRWDLAYEAGLKAIKYAEQFGNANHEFIVRMYIQFAWVAVESKNNAEADRAMLRCVHWFERLRERAYPETFLPGGHMDPSLTVQSQQSRVSALKVALQIAQFFIDHAYYRIPVHESISSRFYTELSHWYDIAERMWPIISDRNSDASGHGDELDGSESLIQAEWLLQFLITKNVPVQPHMSVDPIH